MLLQDVMLLTLSCQSLHVLNFLCSLYIANNLAPEVIKLFYAQLNWNKLSTAQKKKYYKVKKFLALSLSDVVFIMLMNVKMPTIYE